MIWCQSSRSTPIFVQHMTDVRFFFVVNKPCVPHELSKWHWLGARPFGLKYEARVIRPTIKYRDSAWESKRIYCEMYLDRLVASPRSSDLFRKVIVVSRHAFCSHDVPWLTIAATLRSWEIQRPAWYSGWMSFNASISSFKGYICQRRPLIRNTSNKGFSENDGEQTKQKIGVE